SLFFDHDRVLQLSSDSCLSRVKEGLSVLNPIDPTGNKMRKLTLLIGVILLLAGVIAEALYITSARVAYSGIVANIYLISEIICILIGFILMLASVRIPKLRVP